MVAGVCDMSSEFNSIVAKGHDFDCEDPGLGSTNGKVTLGEGTKTNSVYRIFDGFRKQGYAASIRRIGTNTAHRAITDRFNQFP